MTNTLITKTATLIKNNFEDFSTFNFEAEAAKQAVEKYGVAVEDLKKMTNETLGKMFQAGQDICLISPKFNMDNGEVSISSDRFFEIHRSSLALLSFVKSISQYISADKIDSEQSNQFKVFAFYSSIFQSLTCFLALHNIVYIPKPSFDMDMETVETRDNADGTHSEIVKISMNKNNFIRGERKNDSWEFIIANPRHDLRWREYAELLKIYLKNNWEKQVPKDVEKFWGYMKCLGEMSKNYWRKSYEYHINFINKEEFLSTLNNLYNQPCIVRHQKIYEDRFFDLMSYPYVRDGRKVPDEFRDSEIKFFADCAISMILWNFELLYFIFNYLKENLDDKKYTKGLLIFDTNGFIGMAENTYTRLNHISEEVNKIHQNIMPFLDMVFS